MRPTRFVAGVLLAGLFAAQAAGVEPPAGKPKPPPPRINPIDRFVLQKLRKQGLAPATPEFKLEFKLVEVQEQTGADQLAITVHPFVKWRKQGDPHGFTSLHCVKCHTAAGTGNSSEFFWKTFLARPHDLRTWVGNSKGVKVLAMPTISVIKGQTASLEAKSPRKLQFFRQLKPGVFSLEQEEVTTGLSIKAVVQTADDGSVRLKPLTVSVTAVKGREPIKGVTLPVGKPILTTTSISTSVLSKLGTASVISIDSPRGGRVLISVKVTQPNQSAADFLRRAYLDLMGTPPTAVEIRKFTTDTSKDKRRKLIEKLKREAYLKRLLNKPVRKPPKAN